MMIVIWIMIGYGIYYFINKDKTSSIHDENTKTPEYILRERYANGEIDDATFENMKKTLNKR